MTNDASKASTAFANCRFESGRQRRLLTVKAVAPVWADGRSVAGFDIVSNSFTEFRLAADSDATQNRAGHLREEGLHVVEPRRVRRSEHQFKTPGLAGEKASGLARAVGRVIIEQDADQQRRRGARIKLFEKGDELT